MLQCSDDSPVILGCRASFPFCSARRLRVPRGERPHLRGPVRRNEDRYVRGRQRGGQLPRHTGRPPGLPTLVAPLRPVARAVPHQHRPVFPVRGLPLPSSGEVKPPAYAGDIILHRLDADDLSAALYVFTTDVQLALGRTPQRAK